MGMSVINNLGEESYLKLKPVSRRNGKRLLKVSSMSFRISSGNLSGSTLDWRMRGKTPTAHSVPKLLRCIPDGILKSSFSWGQFRSRMQALDPNSEGFRGSDF